MSKLVKLVKKIPVLRTIAKSIRSVIKPSKPSYTEIRKMLEKKDKQNVKRRKELAPLHKRLSELKLTQSEKWDSFVYCDGYFYQGFEKIGISGIKPSEKRVEKYGIQKYLTKDKIVLDIGSNSGFLASYISEFVKEVDAIELNPYLVEMGKETAKFLTIENIDFIEGNFITHGFSTNYDIVFSLSNHFTIDGNLNIDFESYIKKIYDLMKPGGFMMFESHNINGDDKDLDQKFRMASKYFDLIDYKMISAFYPADIDKLFAIFKRLDTKEEPQPFNFNLEEAKLKYEY